MAGDLRPADIPGQPWWCQAPVEKIEGGRFSTKVVFGDEITPPARHSESEVSSPARVRRH